MRARLIFLVVAAALLAACAGPPPVPGSAASSTGPYQATPDGHYRVRRGDSLYAIAFRYGLDWRDIARWNGINAPYVIHPDQLLRLGPEGVRAHPPVDGVPEPAPSSGVTIRPATGMSGASTRAVETPGTDTPEPESREVASAEPLSAAAPDARDAARPDPAAVSAPPPTAGPLPTVSGADPVNWLWPAEGRLLSRFQAGNPARKGIDIAGEVGRPIIASASGLVVYSGSGLIGYGELIIIKHSDRMLSAYAHNSRRLVNEGEYVAAGSQIAEMGNNDRNQAVLHFEVRVNGTPEDPMKYLPQR